MGQKFFPFLTTDPWHQSPQVQCPTSPFNSCLTLSVSSISPGLTIFIYKIGIIRTLGGLIDRILRKHLIYYPTHSAHWLSVICT